MAYDYDEKDAAILRVLCTNARLSYREIAKQLKIHPNTVIERMKKMEKYGVIERYISVIDHKKLGYGITAMIQVDISGKADNAMKKIARLRCVHDTYRTTGEYDGVVFAVCRDIDEMGRVVNEINEVDGVQRVNTKVVLDAYPGSTCPALDLPNAPRILYK